MCEVLYGNKDKGRACIYAKEMAQQRRRKGREHEGIVIESDLAEGMGYTDILKKIKSEIVDRRTLENIKEVRKTVKGNVIITTI